MMQRYALFSVLFSMMTAYVHAAEVTSKSVARAESIVTQEEIRSQLTPNGRLIAAIIGKDIEIPGGKKIHNIDLEGVQKALKEGANPNAPFDQAGIEEMPLCYVVERGQKEVVELLLQYGASVNKRAFGYTAPLVRAADKDACLLELLLERGADCHIANRSKATALHYALDAAVPEKNLALLLAHKADINHQSLFGYTVLHDAVAQAKFGCAKYLLNARANPFIENCNEKNTCDLIRERSFEKEEFDKKELDAFKRLLRERVEQEFAKLRD